MIPLLSPVTVAVGNQPAPVISPITLDVAPTNLLVRWLQVQVRAQNRAIASVLAVVIGPSETDKSRYFATRGFTTTASDSPAHTEFAGRIVAAPEIASEIQVIWWGSGGQRFAVGAIDLINTDGALSSLVQGARDRSITLYTGAAGAPFSEFRILLQAVISDAVIEGNVVRCTLADVSAKLDRPLQSALYTGTLIGQPKPCGFGFAASVPPVSVTPSALYYELHDLPPASISAVRAQGDLLTPGTQWSPSGNGFTLNTAPIGRITADVLLDPAIALPAIMTWLLARAGSPPVDTTSVLRLDGLAPYEYAYWTQTSTTIRDVLQRLLDSIGGWWCVDKRGRLRLGRLDHPQYPSAVIGYRDLSAETDVGVVADYSPGLTSVAACQRNWHVHTQPEIAGSVATTTFGLQLQQDYRVRKTATPSAPPVVVLPGDDTKYTSSAELDVRPGTSVGRTDAPLKGGLGTLLTDPVDAQAEVDRWKALYALRRVFVSFQVPVALLPEIEIGGCWQLHFPRHGITYRNMTCISIRHRAIDGQVQLTFWG
jgi:hypothetical protein